MRHQPIPDVTPDDVERVVRRDFPEKAWADVRSVLDRYGSSSGPPRSRVQLAVLKLADGDRSKLLSFMESARQDYRDVLAWAEYPNYMEKVPGPERPPDVERIHAADWEQYRAWLER